MLLADIFPGCEVVEAAGVDEAIDKLSRESVDVILLDLAMPEMDGFQGLHLFCESWPNIPVVVMTSSDSKGDVHRAFLEGARGYIIKSATTRALRHAIALVLAGELFIPAIVVQQGCPRTGNPCDGGGGGTISSGGSGGEARLTPRQQDVLRGMARGLSNKEIARDLGMLEGTVKVHVKAILQKLNVRNRTEAVMACVKNGVIPSGSIKTAEA